MPATGHFRTRPTLVRKARADARDLSVTAVLTSPGVDLAGDIVRPAGLDFRRHQASPWVDLEHAGRCVGWARKSLSRPGGEYGVRWADLTVGGDSHRLPVGTTWFDPNDRLQAQVFALVERDALPGVSLEFLPVPGFMKSLGRSPLEPRDAYEFSRAEVVRWTHCAKPVNESALTVTKAVPTPDPLLSILSAGKVGSEPLHDTITKALSHYLPPRRLHRVEKAMNPDEATETVYDPETPDTVAADGDEGQATPTAQAAYDAGQMLTDACQQIKTALGSSEHVAGRKKLTALCDQLDKLAKKAVAIGDMVAADVGGDGDMDEDDPEPEVEADALEPDEEGVVKALSAPHRRIYRKAVRRFTAGEVDDGVKKAMEAEAEIIRARIAKNLKTALKIRRRG